MLPALLVGGQKCPRLVRFVESHQVTSGLVHLVDMALGVQDEEAIRHRLKDRFQFAGAGARLATTLCERQMDRHPRQEFARGEWLDQVIGRSCR